MIGKTFYLRWDFEQTTAGGAGSGNYGVSLPPGCTADIDTGASLLLGVRTVGTSLINDGTTYGMGMARMDSATVVGLVHHQNTSDTTLGWSNTAFSLASANLAVSFEATIPLV